MHEFGMCDGIVEAVQWRANGRRVARVKIRVGVMHRVVKEAFQQAFSHAAEGTEAESASLDIVVFRSELSVDLARPNSKARISQPCARSVAGWISIFAAEKNLFWSPSNTRQRATRELKEKRCVSGNSRTDH